LRKGHQWKDKKYQGQLKKKVTDQEKPLCVKGGGRGKGPWGGGKSSRRGNTGLTELPRLTRTTRQE